MCEGPIFQMVVDAWTVNRRYIIIIIIIIIIHVCVCMWLVLVLVRT